ncbi:uncharacterized protein P174DRAFT_457961 [Aspergillus novofumigatus IBT 16806]|uniref:Aminoglycoside phosphotransferase domain-containing protein n=1 Tax=Aspergillus novofumigatus (strain IBT 16806) TaxID=1392255 RepID=A0A2I1CI23_ASPN1|nr:uncharacterized protein P174DRAFT_457961 [Aspergillus novofumigatus IBT 16806]PKX97275.1 hypothetical protein P174DRAFT_457961 [Aspergillus novofumigatus IBT 16806]
MCCCGCVRREIPCRGPIFLDKNGRHVIARLPYPFTVPEHYTIASKAATLDYLRLHGIPTPEVYAWCSTKANPVGADEIWYTMTPKQQHKVMKQIIQWETQFMSLKFPAYRSLYYQKDIPTERKVPLQHLNGQFYVGLIAHYRWWHSERSILDINRGPWSSSTNLFPAIGEWELAWAKAYAKPRLPYECIYREIYGYHQLAALHILPLRLAASIPKDLTSYPFKRLIWKRLIYFLYAAFTRRLNEEHFNTKFDQSAILHQRLFESSSSPWEGDSISLKANMTRAIQSWSNLTSADSVGRGREACNTPSLTYSDRVVRDTPALDAQQKEADDAMDHMRNVLGVDEYKAAKAMAREIKAKMIQVAEMDEDRIAIQNHFPFDDFDEKS